MKIMLMVAVAFATSYLAGATPLNVTNSSICYCRVNKNSTDDIKNTDDIENETYRLLNSSLRTLHTYCHLPDLECNSSSEIRCDNCMPLFNISSELETLLGILQPLSDVCEDEEKKFFRGEQSLYELCIAIDCEVKPTAQSVAKYLISRSERCDCERDYLYVPGNCVEFEGTKSITHVFSALYDSVKSLGVLFCHLQVHPPFVDVEEICAAFPPNDSGDIGDQAPPAPDGDLD